MSWNFSFGIWEEQMGVSMTDTIFIIFVGLAGFIMGAAAVRDIEDKTK